ncbi:MAG: winged helix-turn-helix domain-containing protein [Endomicrobiia bacterium]
MDISEIGVAAGKIWTYLNQKQSLVDVLEIKFHYNFSNTILFLAIGWLAREDKIFMVKENNRLKIKLK